MSRRIKRERKLFVILHTFLFIEEYKVLVGKEREICPYVYVHIVNVRLILTTLLGRRQRRLDVAGRRRDGEAGAHLDGICNRRVGLVSGSIERASRPALTEIRVLHGLVRSEAVVVVVAQQAVEEVDGLGRDEVVVVGVDEAVPPLARVPAETGAVKRGGETWRGRRGRRQSYRPMSSWKRGSSSMWYLSR